MPPTLDVRTEPDVEVVWSDCICLSSIEFCIGFASRLTVYVCNWLVVPFRSSRRVMFCSCYLSSSVALSLSLWFGWFGWFGSFSFGYASVVITKGRGLTGPRPCSSTHPQTKPTTHRHRRPHAVNTVLSRPFGRVTTACVSSPSDWAVSLGSHIQQDMVITLAPPTSRRTWSPVQSRNLVSKN